MGKPSAFEQFVRFSNDSVGLERLLRLLQSLIQILTSYPLLLTLAFQLVDSSSSFTLLSLSSTLLALRGRIALARRFLRVFRFLDNFLIAYRLSTGTLTAVNFLTALSRTFNGCYLLLESSTLPDALGVEGLWSPVTAVGGVVGLAELLDEEGKAGGFDPVVRANLEAQRFWFLSLVCAIAAGTVKLAKLRSERASAGKSSQEQKPKEQQQQGKGKGKGNKKWRSKASATRGKADAKGESFVVVRKLVADFLDLALPGSVVGWVPLETGPVSIAMLGSTVLTGWEVWDKIGLEMKRGSS